MDAKPTGPVAGLRAALRVADRGTPTHAAQVVAGVPVYACADHDPGDAATARALSSEWADVLRIGAGVLVLRGAYADTAPVDAATATMTALIAAERAAGTAQADHFAAAGANDRLWNALQKLALAAPSVFVRYHGNPWVDLACRAWLGPGYAMTAQVNLVHPGGAAQEAHRDYHLGFMTAEAAAAFPSHAHALSPMLTLQGAIAHCDMPVESGPTRLLPHSQLWAEGYVHFRDADVRTFFEAEAVQLPLAKGDCLFLNPALLHAAGANRTSDVARLANLLQVSSAMGVPMEAVDRDAMARALYPALAEPDLDPDVRRCAIAACAAGYPFPTNLDTDPPAGGLAPPSQQALLTRALDEGWDQARFDAALDAAAAKRRP